MTGPTAYYHVMNLTFIMDDYGDLRIAPHGAWCFNFAMYYGDYFFLEVPYP